LLLARVRLFGHQQLEPVQPQIPLRSGVSLQIVELVKHRQLQRCACWCNGSGFAREHEQREDAEAVRTMSPSSFRLPLPFVAPPKESEMRLLDN